MIQPKTHTTTKLFYRSFPYKALINYEWANVVGRFTERDIPIILSRKFPDRSGRYESPLVRKYPKEVVAFIKFLKKYDKTQLRTRSEGYSLSLFFKDRSLYEELENISKNHRIVDEFWEPASPESLDFMQTNRRVEVKNALTHGCRYKVVINGNWSNISNDGRNNFINLVDRHPTQFHISNAVKSTINRGWYSYGGTIYVKDSKFLLIVQMSIQSLIKEVVKIVTLEEVNNGTQDSTTF